ncbi:MAG: hypothetical protein Q9220_004416 [cf. Caloplaca sp. 1 TL-2023]
MFDQYFQLGYRLRKHYLSPRVVLCLSTGQFLPPLDRKSLYSLQYSMLPAERAGVYEVWKRLTESAPTRDSGTDAQLPPQRDYTATACTSPSLLGAIERITTDTKIADVRTRRIASNADANDASPKLQLRFVPDLHITQLL